MALISLNNVYQLAILSMVITVVVCRPPHDQIENEISPDVSEQYQPTIQDLKNLFTALHQYYDYYTDESGKGDRFRYPLDPSYAFDGSTAFKRSPAGVNFNRLPDVIKRQVRYRQCYFNPISCFRK